MISLTDSRITMTSQGLLAIKYFGELSHKFRLLLCIPEELKEQTILKTWSWKSRRNSHYWPRLAQQVELHVKACEKCYFHNEDSRTKPKMHMKLYEQRNEPNYSEWCFLWDHVNRVLQEPWSLRSRYVLENETNLRYCSYHVEKTANNA